MEGETLLDITAITDITNAYDQTNLSSEMDVQATVNETDEAFNGLGCIISIMYHTAIGANVLSEVDVPHKNHVTFRHRIQVELHQKAGSFCVNSDTANWVHIMVIVQKQTNEQTKKTRTSEIRMM